MTYQWKGQFSGMRRAANAKTSTFAREQMTVWAMSQDAARDELRRQAEGRGFEGQINVEFVKKGAIDFSNVFIPQEDIIHATLRVLKTKIEVTSAYRWAPSRKDKKELVMKYLTKREMDRLSKRISAAKS